MIGGKQTRIRVFGADKAELLVLPNIDLAAVNSVGFLVRRVKRALAGVSETSSPSCGHRGEGDSGAASARPVFDFANLLSSLSVGGPSETSSASSVLDGALSRLRLKVFMYDGFVRGDAVDLSNAAASIAAVLPPSVASSAAVVNGSLDLVVGGEGEGGVVLIGEACAAIGTVVEALEKGLVAEVAERQALEKRLARVEAENAESKKLFATILAAVPSVTAALRASERADVAEAEGRARALLLSDEASVRSVLTAAVSRERKRVEAERRLVVSGQHLLIAPAPPSAAAASSGGKPLSIQVAAASAVKPSNAGAARPLPVVASHGSLVRSHPFSVGAPLRSRLPFRLGNVRVTAGGVCAVTFAFPVDSELKTTCIFGFAAVRDPRGATSSNPIGVGEAEGAAYHSEPGQSYLDVPDTHLIETRRCIGGGIGMNGGSSNSTCSSGAAGSAGMDGWHAPRCRKGAEAVPMGFTDGCVFPSGSAERAAQRLTLVLDMRSAFGDSRFRAFVGAEKDGVAAAKPIMKWAPVRSLFGNAYTIVGSLPPRDADPQAAVQIVHVLFGQQEIPDTLLNSI